MGSYFFLEFCTLVFALSIATTLFNKRILGFPVAIGVPIVSAIFVFLLQWLVSVLGNNVFISINIDAIEAAVREINFYDFLINGVICFILTASALTFKISDLKAYWKPIAILASIALVLCALFFAGGVYGLQFLMGQTVPIAILLLLGSALGATDPIGIKGVLASVKAPHHLMVKLEGESLFNDAVCIALFMTILAVIQGAHFTISGTLGHLFKEIIVAVVIGGAFGVATLYLLKGKHEMESLILSTALLASGSYLVALYAHASAPIACVVGGLIVGNKWRQILEKHEITEVNHFWHTIEGIINAFLFTLIGMELFIIELSAQLILGGVAVFIILHLSRFAANIVAFMFFPSVRKKSYNGSLSILSWGGVRGGISLALILAVANLPALSQYSHILIGYTFICVLLSGVICGLGLPAVMNAFYHSETAATAGFAGWYQRMCNKLNRSGVKYIIETDSQGREQIAIYHAQTDSGVVLDTDNELATDSEQNVKKVNKIEDQDFF